MRCGEMIYTHDVPTGGSNIEERLKGDVDGLFPLGLTLIL